MFLKKISLLTAQYIKASTLTACLSPYSEFWYRAPSFDRGFKRAFGDLAGEIKKATSHFKAALRMSESRLRAIEVQTKKKSKET